MARRIIALGCLVAGVWLLAGLGWALLAAGVLAEVAWPVGRPAGEPRWVGEAARRAREAVATARRAATAIPQQVAAVTGAGAGVILVPTGVGILGGLGAALLVLGALGILFGLLLDRAA